MQKKLYKQIGGCTACGGGNMGSVSRNDAPIELHHIRPKIYGGDDNEQNALIICRDCHVEIHR